MGVPAEELPDGMYIPGRQKFRAAEIESFGDHRIAMAFAVAGLAADGTTVIQEAESASVSFPQFWDTLGAVVG
jgi:3-phosphoshikimate 1-carboxyvinyltransferase